MEPSDLNCESIHTTGKLVDFLQLTEDHTWMEDSKDTFKIYHLSPITLGIFPTFKAFTEPAQIFGIGLVWKRCHIRRVILE